MGNVDACFKLFGEPSSVLDTFDGDQPCGFFVWTLDETAARDQGIVRGLFSDAPTIVPRRRDDAHRFWPRVAFSSASTLDDAPNRLFDTKPLEVVGDEAGIWFHFVDDPAHRTRHSKGSEPYSCAYAEAVRAGVWGIEEGYCEGGSYPAGWWVASSPDPGEQPDKLHSVF